MVIQQFNKLIRNKWVWGVFAIAVSAIFCLDDLLVDRGGGQVAGTAGTLGDESVTSEAFQGAVNDVRGPGNNRSNLKSHEINRMAWETLAAMAVAKANGIQVSDTEVSEAIRRDRSFAPDGKFSYELYERVLRENQMTPAMFESFLRRRLLLNRVASEMVDTASWVSPAELDRAVADMTDEFSVRVARFKQSKEDAEAIKLDDEGLKKWYDKNSESLALPRRLKLRMVKFDASDTNVQARLAVSEDELRDHYDATVDKYTTTDTNGVETVQAFSNVIKQVEKEYRQIAALQYFETNVNMRAYGVKAAEGCSRLDEIAKEDGLKVTTSDWFSIEGGVVEGFMKPAYLIAPGAESFNETVAELDPESEDLRYGVLRSDKAVWLVEQAAVSETNTPSFAEAKEIIRPRAVKAAQEDAFKAAVDAIIARGTNAVLSAKNVTTNFTFSIGDLKQGDFDDQAAIAGAVRKLKTGEISEFVATSPRNGLVVVCTGRKAGDSSKAVLLSSQIRDSLAMLARRQLPEDWQKWNLERIGFKPADYASILPPPEESEEE